MMDFYYSPASAPCRAARMIAKALKLPLNLKRLDPMKGETTKPEFVKINPQHLIPTLVDNGFVIWESRAIMAYLVEKYARDDQLYPKDPQARATVNRLLFFDMGTLWQPFSAYFIKYVMRRDEDQENKEKIDVALGFLEQELKGKTWVAGESITLADYALSASVSTFEVINYPLQKFPRVRKWLKACRRQLPGYEVNGDGLIELETMLETHMKK